MALGKLLIKRIVGSSGRLNYLLHDLSEGTLLSMSEALFGPVVFIKGEFSRCIAQKYLPILDLAANSGPWENLELLLFFQGEFIEVLHPQQIQDDHSGMLLSQTINHWNENMEYGR